MIEIVAALRVKNEARWIKEVLQAVNWCNAIYLMDDHSTDDTKEIAKSCGAVVLESPFEGFDEGRDKEWLLRNIAKNHEMGTWILAIDGDEVLEPNGAEKIKGLISNNNAIAFNLPILYLWNSRDQIRVDGIYGNYARPRLFKLLNHYSFRRTGVNGNLHCFCVPEFYRNHSVPCKAALLHLGYMNKEDRIRKWHFYNAMDPTNRAEGYDPTHPERGSYPHMIQGDVPEVPANIKLKHAGPLTLKCLQN